MHLRNSLECHLQNTKQKKGNKFVKHQEKNKRDNCIYKTFGKTAQYSGDDLYFVYDPFHLQYVISWRHALPAVFKQGGDDDDRERSEEHTSELQSHHEIYTLSLHDALPILPVTRWMKK